MLLNFSGTPCLLLSVAVNNVGVMYDYPQKFLDVPVEVRFYKVNELDSFFVKFSALGLLQDIRNNFHS